MDSLSQHLDQAINGLDCDMSYQQLSAPAQSLRFDQEQKFHQHQQQLRHLQQQPHHHQTVTSSQQNFGQRTVEGVVNQCETITYHHQSHHHTKHVYEQYPQQVLSLNNGHHHHHHLYMQQQQTQLDNSSSSLYANQAQINRHHQHSMHVAYDTQSSYSPQVQYLPQVQIQVLGSDQYDPIPNRQSILKQHNQYQYGGLVMQHQQQPPPSQPPLPQPPLQHQPLPLRQPQQQQIHHHHPQNQDNFGQHTQLMTDYQQPFMTTQNSVQFAPTEVIDNQIFYQEQMDLHPTIKQQEQQQQQQASLIQESSVSPIGMVSGGQPTQQLTSTNIDPYTEVPLCAGQLLASQASVVEPEVVQSSIVAQQQQHLYSQTATMHQLISRSKSDLNTSSMKNSFFAPTDGLQLRSQELQQRSRSSNLAYVEQQQPQLQQQQRNFIAEPNQKQQHQEFLDIRSNGNISQGWLDTICGHLIDHMNRFGICVIDNFLGPLKGDSILREVKQLYSGGHHSTGRLMNNKLASRNEDIRNDRVIWIDGCEDGCSEINNLIHTLCSVITNSSRLSLYSNNGLDKIVIKKRTKAHVACYPGNGTRYIKHVDNPNGDGRVITSIYYLNKDWKTKHDGGLLRMFPVGMNEVANIEPLFDRALFFWSDRRNPHEVLPAYRDRFAITVWYIGENRP